MKAQPSSITVYITMILTLLVAVAAALGFTPDPAPSPEIVSLAAGIAALVTAVAHWWASRQAAVRETALKEEVAQARDLAAARNLNDPATYPRQ
jgi:membrane protein YdbS with pleckstrin-like domain